MQCRKYYEAWRLLYVGVLFSSAFESDTFPVRDLKWTPNLATILIEAAEGTDASSLTPEADQEPEPDQTRDLPGTRTSPIREKLVFIHLTPGEKRRAKRANRSITSITHAVSCGSYGMFFGTEERCRSEYETWRKLYVGVLFEKTFSSYSWQVSDYKTTPDLANILAKAAGSSSGLRSDSPQARRLPPSRRPRPPSRSGTGNKPHDVDVVAAAVVKAQEQAKAKERERKVGSDVCLYSSLVRSSGLSVQLAVPIARTTRTFHSPTRTQPTQPTTTLSAEAVCDQSATRVEGSRAKVVEYATQLDTTTDSRATQWSRDELRASSSANWKW